MAYAGIEDVRERKKASAMLDETLCIALLDDAAIIIDSYNENARSEAKRLVSCNMVLRVLGDDDVQGIPIGANQGSISALGYSQSWTMSSGSARELYLSKTDKKILGQRNGIGFMSLLEEI